ncbi:MAG: hypothetical protein A2600_11825 [Candidatus Lambdaproteobacteria bacterium RIFOXYD1_FULL_56_27]|uniref:Uncharacterized protein n=1 Tax=Candidatus Lambdaproteobacteria bacterium RIFOXYD2_FULL_56_26 TaxID=1817773 RepID=A0A1F6GXC4_9PROT|nr:MAG: hypothetical protein A2426_12160 [Candidatus Lambdaproteobacteria bacterium RIFOXYC1_FULL_56_13]OGH02788.1 MAG: hypothetical protein A2557_02940 [Candidatus Lambdaproteobacteria bacterium RIFOXYD2_FULL_56_26]OGH08031.1 MAG: hypothetical protein A2600_11825 [Candidatus Lambdaproteobacteria bacterium RIFOXYD1_FULL_56_27]
MASFKKGLFILGLLVVSLTASAFMVLEAGYYYQSLYPQSSFGYMGYLAATLNEAFMAIMAGVWLPGKVRGKGHPVNFLFRFLLILLFFTTVGGASFNAISEHLSVLESQANNRAVVEILKSQVEDHEKSLATFSEQRQKMNSALTVRNQLATKQRLVEAMEQQKAVTGLWMQVIFLVVLRVAVQLANLSCVWLVGWVWRRKETVSQQAREAGVLVETKSSVPGRTAPTLLDHLLQDNPEKALPAPEARRGPAWQPKTPPERTFTPYSDRAAGETTGTTEKNALQAQSPSLSPAAPALKLPEEAVVSAVVSPPEQAPTKDLSRSEAAGSALAGIFSAPLPQRAKVLPEPEVALPVGSETSNLSPKQLAPVPAPEPAAQTVLPVVFKDQTPPLESKDPPQVVTAPVEVPGQMVTPEVEPALKMVQPEAQVCQPPAEPIAAPAVAPEVRPPVQPLPPRAGKALPFPQKAKAPQAPAAEAVVEVQDFEQQELKRLRTRIVRLANQRNPGVSLSAFCAALGESPVELREIANFQAELSPQLAERLEEIVGKIERLHQSQWAANG